MATSKPTHPTAEELRRMSGFQIIKLNKKLYYGLIIFTILFIIAVILFLAPYIA